MNTPDIPRALAGLTSGRYAAMLAKYPPASPYDPFDGLAADLAEQRRTGRIASWDKRCEPWLRNADLDRLPTDLRRTVEGWEVSDAIHLYLWGGLTGTGKTWTGYALLNRAVAGGNSVDAISETALAEVLTSREDDHARRNLAAQADMLLVDEVADSPRMPDFKVSAITQLVEARANNNRRTIFTSNHAPNSGFEIDGDDLLTLRPRLRSRILMRGTAIEYPIGLPDWRDPADVDLLPRGGRQ